MDRRDFGHRYGGKTNNAQAALRQTRDSKAIAKSVAPLPTPALVYDQDPVTGLVSVLLKEIPGRPILEGIPVAGFGGRVRVRQPFRTVRSGSKDPDMGTVVWLDMRTALSLSDKRVAMTRESLSAYPYFWPGTPSSSQEASPHYDATGADPNKAGPSDLLIELLPATVGGSGGAAIIVKSTGQILLASGTAPVVINDPSGGLTVDSQARAAIATIIDILVAHRMASQ